MNRIALAALSALALFAFAFWPRPASAADCLAVKHTYEKLDSLIASHGGKRTTLEGRGAAAYLGIINSVPPATHLESELIVIWERDSIVAIGARRPDGLVCPIGHVSPAVHQRAMKAVGTDT